jgi:AraC-like DNA-binding protein
MIWSDKSSRRGKFDAHRHDMHELFICLNDFGVQYIGGEKCGFSRGRAFFLFSGISHALECDMKNGGEFVFFCFDPKYFLSREMSGMHDNIQRLADGRNYFSGADPDYLAENVRIANELYSEINNPRMLSEEKITALLTCLIASFSRSLESETSDNMENDSSKLAQLCRRIRKHPEVDYRLSDAVGAAAMSRSKFAVRFKEYTGMTMMEYVIEFRLKYACNLLSDKDTSVLEAALQSGFNNAGYFHRQFKKRFGITPLQMKKRYIATRFPQLLKEY